MSNLDVAVTLRLVNQMSGPARAAAEDLARVKTAAKGLEANVGSKLAGDLNRVAAAGGKVGAEMRMAGTATATFGAQLDRAAAAGGKVSASLGGARNAIQGANAAAGALAASLGRAASAAARVTMPAGNLRPWRGGAGKAGPAGPHEAAGSGLSAIGPAALGYVAVREAARRTIGEAITMEKAWAEVQKKVNDAPNPAAMQELERVVRRTGIELGIPREKVAALTAEAGAAGIKFQDLERFVRLTAKASIGWDMTPEDTAQKLAEIKSGTGMTIGQMEVLADKINALGDNSAAKERDIVEMFGRSGAAAKAAGVDYDTSLAVLTAVRSAGMQPEIVSRWFNAFSGGLRTIQDGKKGAKEALKSLGLDADQVAEGMRKNSLGTMLDLFDRLAKAPEGVRAAVKLFGKEWWDETMRANATMPEIRKQLELLQTPSRYQGSLGQNLNIQLATTANHLERLKALASEVGDRLGRWALPGINKDVEWAISKLDELDRRARVKAAGQSEPSGSGKLPPDLRLERWVKDRAQAAGGAVLDHVLGKDATVDPSRAVAGQLTQSGRDIAETAKKKREEADLLETRAERAKGKIQKELWEQAAKARAEAAGMDADASLQRRGAGPHGARDMTDVEVGDAAATRSIEERRAATTRAAEIRAALDARRRLQERYPQRTFAHQAELEAELEAQGARIRALGAGASVQPVPGARAGFGLTGPSGDGVAGPAGVPRFGGSTGPGGFPMSLDMKAPLDAAARLKAGLTVDLAAAATTSMAGYNSALSAGISTATATAIAGAATMKAALSFTATPTISPRITVPTTAGGSAGSAAGGATAAAARSGGGGVTIHSASFHGVNDMAGLHREASRLADQRVREARSDALHDVGSFA